MEEEIRDRLHAERILKREGIRVSGRAQGELMLQAARIRFNNIVDFFLKSTQVDFKNKFQDSLLHFAAKGGNLELIQSLLQHEIDPLPRNLFGETPLMNAAEEGHLPIINELIKYGGAHIRDKFGDTALHFAAREGHGNICEVIINADPRIVNIINDHRATPLAYCYQQGHLDVAKLLESFGGKTSITNEEEIRLKMAMLL